MNECFSDVRGVVLVNRQKQYALRRSSLLAFARDLKHQLRLARKDFNLCFVDDPAIRRLNSTYRGKDKATDVLSFPWNEGKGNARPGTRSLRRVEPGKTSDFLGEIVISVPAARRNARGEGHSTLNEIRWLVLHGVLHLLGYDHACDNGEMTALELVLREKLGISGMRTKNKSKGKTSKGKA
jgi:probable rRNA maturation factor